MNLEKVLVGIDCNVNDAMLAQVKKVVDDADFSATDLDHIINLHEKVKVYGGFVALSNSEDVFKVKSENYEPAALKDFNLTVHNWGEKYNFKVKKLEGKETYYITGKND